MAHPPYAHTPISTCNAHFMLVGHCSDDSDRDKWHTCEPQAISRVVSVRRLDPFTTLLRVLQHQCYHAVTWAACGCYLLLGMLTDRLQNLQKRGIKSQNMIPLKRSKLKTVSVICGALQHKVTTNVVCHELGRRCEFRKKRTRTIWASLRIIIQYFFVQLS